MNKIVNNKIIGFHKIWTKKRYDRKDRSEEKKNKNKTRARGGVAACRARRRMRRRVGSEYDD
jgi:hypothetical protein